MQIMYNISEQLNHEYRIRPTIDRTKYPNLLVQYKIQPEDKIISHYLFNLMPQPFKYIYIFIEFFVQLAKNITAQT